jgi:hypothetical protein
MVQSYLTDTLAEVNDIILLKKQADQYYNKMYLMEVLSFNQMN